MEISLREIAELVGGELVAEEEVIIRGVQRLDLAGPSDISVVYNRQGLALAEEGEVGAVLIPTRLDGCSKPAIRVENPRLAFAQVLELFAPPREVQPGIHPTAVVGEGVQLGQEVSVGAGTVIESGAIIGDRTVIGALVYLGRRVRVGNDVVLHPHVTLYDEVVLGNRVIIHSNTVIGSDGFGYLQVDAHHRKIPQLGKVVIGDDVEIGAGVTIDRATTGATEIGAGTKIDNLVQIGHNVRIGKHCIIVAQTGIAGSTVVGDYALIGGQVGITDHVTIGEGAKIASRAGVTGNLPPGAFVSGYPARPHQEQMRILAAIRKTPWLLKTVRALEKKVAALTEALGLTNDQQDGEQ